MAFPFAVWLTSRAVLALASWVGMSVEGRLLVPFQAGNLYPGVPALEGWCRWDCEWFLAVARGGYANGSETNFFPLLPLLTHALWLVMGIPHHWGILLVSNAACLAAYVVLYRMFRRLADQDGARWGVALFAAYPFAFFHAAGYPESLMVLLSALAIDLALRGRHLNAGLVLAAGVLARHLTLLAEAGLLVAQVQQRPSPGRFFKNPAWLALALPVVSILGFCLYQKIVWGNFLAFYEARALWGPLANWSLWDHLLGQGALSRYRLHLVLMSTYLPFAAMTAAGVLLTVRRRSAWPVAAFGLVLSVVIWAVGLWGLGRYSASCWPAFLGLGALAARWPMLGPLLLTGFAVFQGIFFFLFMHQYPVL
jgi:mannosyltransferase PIG-V